MIFKTFDSDIDKISAKWGVFGKSFNEIGTAIARRISDINKGFQATDDLLDAFGDTDSIWKRLYPSKESIQAQMIDVDKLYPDKTDAQFSTLLNRLQQQQKLITETKGNWSDYFKNFQEGEKWQIDFVQNTDLQKASLDDVKKGYENARQAAIAHNAALKQQTLGAKATTLALKALSIAGNMLLSFAISKTISFVIESIGNYVARLENAKEKLTSITEEITSIDNELKNVNKTIDEILGKDTLEITDENELKKLREEVDLLENKKKLLESQEYEQQKETNKIVSDKYDKYFKSAIVTTPDGAIEEVSGLSYIEDLYNRAKNYASYDIPLTEDEKLDFDGIKEGAVDIGLELTELLENFEPITEEERKQKEEMEQMLHLATQITELYAGTSYELGERLIEKFASGDNSKTNKSIEEWINSLSDEEKRIMIKCELDNPSLNDLKKYLAEQTDEIQKETKATLSDAFALKDSSDNATVLSNLKDKLTEVETAYKTCLSAKEEYDAQGYLSVETLEKVLSLGEEYLQYLFNEQGNVKLDAEAFQNLALARINAMETQALSNLAKDIEQITNEATATDYLAKKQNELASSYTDVAASALLALKTIDGFSDSEALQGAYNSLNARYEQIKGLFAKTKAGLGANFSGKSTGSFTVKDQISAYMDFQKKSLEKGKIDYYTYSSTVSNYLKNMWNSGKISAKEYYDYTGEMLENQKSIMDKVVSAVQNRIDKEIDGIKLQQDEIQKKIDLLNDENDANQRAYNLEKARYELEKFHDTLSSSYSYCTKNATAIAPGPT